MILRNDTCNDVSLQNLLTDKESSDEFRMTLKHVDSCAWCQARLEQIAAGEELWDEAQSVFSGSTFSSSEAGISQTPATWYGRTIVWNETMASRLLSPPTHPEMLGRIGRYDIERLIGSGGMGLVFKAHDSELNRPVAIKLLAPYLAGNGSARKRFAREARAAAAVVDEHVVAIHNVESDHDPDKAPFLVMKYIAGGSLQQRLDREGPMAIREILRIGMQIAKGLAAAHSQGLIHRDIKPSNILLEEGVDRALLTDFGLARAEDDACLTHSGFQPGTPHYMSPEQVRGESIDGRSDLFGLGCLLYSMCTGHPPFRAESSYAVLRRIVDDEARSIREINSDIPEWLELIVMKLLAKSPDQRFESADSVALLLEECLAHTQHPTVSALPDSIPKPMTKKGIQHPWVKPLVATIFAFLFIFAGVIIVLELNKGTLRIESDLDEVPISVMLGDTVVKKLSVTQSGESVRVAAGKYVVRIDGNFDGFKVDKGNVTLSRGGTRTVRITESPKEPLNAPVIGQTGNAHAINLAWPASHTVAASKTDKAPKIRYVVAPANGVIEKSLVGKGDSVKANQLLANINDKAVKLSLSNAQSAYEKALKNRDDALLIGNIGQSMAAENDAESLEKQIKSLKTISKQLMQRLELRSPVDGVVANSVLPPAKGSTVRKGQVLFKIIEAPQSPANIESEKREFEKLRAEHEKARDAYNLACDNAKDDVELNRVYDELDPREVMPQKYLAFEEKYRGTELGLKALTRVANMASSVGDPDSKAVKGRAKCINLILNHYLEYEGLEAVADSLDGGPSPENIDDFLEALVEKSPHTTTRAAALLAQIKRGKQWLSAENRIDEIRETIKQRFEHGTPEMRAEAERHLAKLQSTDFKQLRKDLNDKLDQLSTKYFDIEVPTYKTGGNAARRISHAINKVIVGKPAPEIEAVDLDGKMFRLSELRGKNVVLVFAHGSARNFAKNYAPVSQLTARFSQAPVRVVGIIGGMSKEELKAARKQGDINWTVIPQPTNGPITLSWGIESYPWAYVVDKDGILRPKIHMPHWGAGGYDTSEIAQRLDVLVGRTKE